jgi:carbonic anhydrase/acetyltransferase-like protein (isoleucine patch superfamily)/uncharacterized membrane protein YoaK (UPF0700 family)
MPSLHTPQTIFSLRHAPSWLLLAFSAGAVNAIAFLACSRFITHVTGTVTLMGMDVRSIPLALDYTLVLGAFILGAMTSAMWIDVRFHRRKDPFYQLPLLAVSGILAALALAGVKGMFGTFGGSIEGTRDFVFLTILAFAMGLQNAAVATSTGLIVRTTHLTGTATDLGVYLATALYAEGDVRRVARLHAALRGGKILAFAAGASAGVMLATRIQYASLFVPATIVLAVTFASFLPAFVRRVLDSKRRGNVRAVLRREAAEARRPLHYEPSPTEHEKWLDQIREQPLVSPSAYVHPAATIIGRVVLADRVHVAADTSIRADEGAPFHIGANTNVQDGVVMHALKDKHVLVEGIPWAIYVAEDVSIAHDALVHGPCYVGEKTFIGFKAVVHDAVVGANCFIGIGAVVVGVEIPDGRFVPHGRIVDSAEAVAALPRVEEMHQRFNEDVVEVNRGLAAAYRVYDREREVEPFALQVGSHAGGTIESEVVESGSEAWSTRDGDGAEAPIWSERWTGHGRDAPVDSDDEAPVWDARWQRPTDAGRF